MGDWDDMVDMGYGNADGTLTEEFYESCESPEYNNKINTPMKYEYMEVMLTPSNYLSSEEKYERALIINSKQFVDWSKFEVMHDSTNQYDHFAIQIFFQKIFIGFVKKHTSISSINSFCFYNDQILDLEINWVKNTFLLRKTTTKDNELEQLVQENIPISIDNEKNNANSDNPNDKLMIYLLDAFEKSHGINLQNTTSQGKMAFQRLKYASEKAREELKYASIVEIDLPFITVTDDGAQHLLIELTYTQLQKIDKN